MEGAKNVLFRYNDVTGKWECFSRNDYNDYWSKNIKLHNLLRKETQLREDIIDKISNMYHEGEIKQFHMFKNRVIDSLNKLDDHKRNLYIKLHPYIPCDDYKEYLEYLNRIF